MAIKVDIFTKNIKMTERLDEYVNKKVTKLYRYLKDIDETRVDLSYIKSARNASDRQVAQLTIRGKGYILRTEERADDIFAAIDEATEKMQRQITRLKGKRQRGRGTGMPLSELASELPEFDEAEELPEITRRKTFALIPMDELEAIEQMKMLGHEDFFVFYNMNTESINILYHRRDGGYGIIEPQLG
ncbi:MAG TPA: ribosome-associated translation inhibitor RaiA [Anaerolineaceae bacterium]|nr:ribosome-associated translation inhibitor RaiA [Anaerolineaceae bacterium]